MRSCPPYRVSKTRSISFWTRSVQFRIKNAIFLGSRKNLKVHSSVEFSEIKSNWLTFFIFFRISIVQSLRIRGTKLLEEFFETGSAGRNRSGIHAFRKRQKAQIVMKILNVEAHFSPQKHGSIRSPSFQLKSVYLTSCSMEKSFVASPVSKNW